MTVDAHAATTHPAAAAGPIARAAAGTAPGRDSAATVAAAPFMKSRLVNVVDARLLPGVDPGCRTGSDLVP